MDPFLKSTSCRGVDIFVYSSAMGTETQGQLAYYANEHMSGDLAMLQPPLAFFGDGAPSGNLQKPKETPKESLKKLETS